MSDKKNIDTRYTTYFNQSELDKLKYIAWYERTPIKTNLSEAIEAYIKRWEKKNGVITNKLLAKIRV